MARELRAGGLGAALAAGWLVVMVVADAVVTDDEVVFSPLFALAPLIACAVLSPALTAVFGGAATALAAAAGFWDHTMGAAQQYVRVTNVALVSAAAVAVAAVRERREHRFARMVAIAEEAQRAVLPAIPAEVEGVRIATRYRSATEEALIGGDLYDVVRYHTAVRVLIGDVRGKGLDAVQQAARVIRAFRQSAAAVPELGQVAESMNDYLMPFFTEEEFVTALLVENRPGGTLSLVNCGHHPPLLAVDGRAQPALELPSALPLGVLAGTYPVTTTTWPPGARLLLYTDGLVEARDESGRFFGTDSVAAQLTGTDMETCLDRLVDAVSAHAAKGRLADDLALVLMERVR